MSFEGCSHVTINKGNISVVAGNQHNCGLGAARRGSMHLVDPSEEGQLETLAQYQELKTGNIRLRRKIAESVVDNRSWKKLDARRIIHAATIHGEDKEEEFLHVQYLGPDAVQVYKQDLKAFSAVKSINHVQLFGYSNWNRLPSLVFYDALVPLSHVFERNGFLALLRTYFRFASLQQGIDAFTLLGELWIKPRTGTLCKGPYVKDSYSTLSQLWLGTIPALPNNHSYPDLQTYSNTSLLFQYLIRIFPVCSIIDGIRRSDRLSPDWPNTQDAKLILSSLPGTIYCRTSQEVIAQYLGDREGWYYGPCKELFHIPDAIRENTLKMDDQSMRFMLKPVDIASLESFQLYYELQPGRVWNSFADSWVSQAHGIFSQLGIEEGEWGKYSRLDHFYLYFEWKQDKEQPHIHTSIPLSTPIYLFIRPVPCPSDNKNGWDDWLGGRKYYWSFDPAGKEEILEGEQQRLGLPLFRTSVQVWHRSWDCDAYDAIEMVNHHQCFDPKSLELARSLDYPILEVVGGNTRFEEVEDKDDNSVAIDTSVEPAQQSTLPLCFKERIQWIRDCSVLSGYMRRSLNKDTLCSDRPDIADVD